MKPDPAELSRLIAQGHKRAIARAISIIENGHTQARSILEALHPRIGRAHRIGITGPPGVGKSTLTNQIIKYYRKKEISVGVIAVDPSSPFTGGAILGDRVRMQDLFTDPGVFIRSMATRGSLGGLARQASEAADVLDAAGKDVIIMETVGVGQVELDIMNAADTILVVNVPDTGDVIQGMKAGLMEIGDVFIVNKADLEGAERMKTDIQFVLELKGETSGWQQQVFLVDSRKGTGLDDMLTEIDRHKNYLNDAGEFELKRLRRKREQVKSMIMERLGDVFWNKERSELLEKLLEKKSPVEIVDRMLS
jgi:LAO/AO transport system kinase